MTLQDDVAKAFIEMGMKGVVKELTMGEEPLSPHMEEPVGKGWVDISVKTKNHRLLFEVKTHVRLTDTGETHEPNVGGAIRQLKKYRKSHPDDIISIMIPQRDARKWASLYSNEGFGVVVWNAKRQVRCPTCKREIVVGLVAPNYCGMDYCGYRGPFEQVDLIEPDFYVYRTSPARIS